MSNFNQYFRNTGVKIMVDKFFRQSNIDKYNPDNKITSLDYEIIEEPPQPASYYIENGLTATHKVRINYTINEDDELKYAEFEVPKEIDGAFIIEGAYRISTNKMNADFDCRIRMSGTGEYTVKFDYDRTYDINKKILKITRINPDLGISEKAMDIHFDDIDKTLETDKKDILKLTERQSKKLMIKLDLDYKPEYITQKLIQDCMAFGDDRLKDLIIDKTIESVPNGFMKYLFRDNNRRNYYSACRRINSYFTKYGRIQDQVTAITTLCFRYFKGAKDISTAETGIQVPPGVNSINLEAISNKIVIPDSIAYNTTFSDLIDIADTPINNNTNLQNSLTVSCHITDDDILFDVYDKNFMRITIPYIDYLNHKVCASEFVDYETNTIKPNKDGQVEVKYRMKRRMVPVEEIELIDLHPDYRLSGTTRRIPFVNYTDSVRISMGTSMLKQSIPLVNAERPLVDTGRSEELKDNILNEKFQYPEGKVKDITDDKVVIELPDGTETEILRRTAIQSINDVAVFTEPKVKIGQKVKQGDIITGAVGHTLDTYKSGVNALVLFHAYHGLVNEDALVISESFANRIASYSIIDLMINVKNISAIKWIAPIGTKVKSKDPVVTLYKAVRLDAINAALQEKLGGLFGEGRDLTEYTIEDHLKVPNNIDEAWVSDVMVQEMKNPKIPKSVKAPDYSFAHTSQDVINEYEKNKDRKVIYDKFPEYVAADTLDPINMDPDAYKIVYTVRIRLIKRTIGMIGSKITSRYGGKGVVSCVKPDEQMPIMVDKFGNKTRVEVVMNPYSTINRKIPSVLMEFALGNIAHRLHDLVDEYKKTKTGQKKIKPLLEKYYPGRFDSLTTEEIIDRHNSSPIEEMYYFNVGCFSTKFTPELVNEWSDELGVESQSKILMPENELTDLDELKENLDPEEYEQVVKNITGKFIEVDKPLMTGYMCLEELYHIPSYSNKVTTSLYGVDVNPRRDEPILGRGRYRLTGQKIDEMSLSVLLSRNAKKFIESTRKDTATEDNQLFLNNLLGLGLTVVDDKGFNQGGSSLKKELNDLKVKFRRKNNLLNLGDK